MSVAITTTKSSAISVYPLCRHIKTNGCRCQSPALRGHSLCHFHRKLRQMHRPAATPQSEIARWRPETLRYFQENGIDPLAVASANPRPSTLKVLPLEDAESIQLAISTLFAALANREVEPSHARNLLYALQLASYNARAVARLADPAPSAIAIATGNATAIAHASANQQLSTNNHQLAPNDDFARNPNPQTILPNHPSANSNGQTNLPVSS